MAGQDIVQPNNTIIVKDDGLVIEEFEVGANATAAEMLPGSCVIYDTVAGDIKESGAAADGVVGILMEKANGLLTDAYAVGDVARVITGGNGQIMVRRKANAGNIVVGTPLRAGADGLLEIRAAAAMGSQGDLVAESVQILADSTVIANVVARIKIVADQAAAS